MKRVLYIFICFSLFKMTLGQKADQGVRLLIKQQSKAGNQPLVNTTVNVIINDTSKYTLTSDDKGYLKLIEIPEGRCTIGVKNIRLKNDSCEVWGVTSVNVEKEKITYVSVNYACGAYKDELKTRGKKKFGEDFFYQILGQVFKP